ncbi:MAG: adenylyltransferase/cytidyltransferase family protein [Hyphomicrobiales bacterium]
MLKKLQMRTVYTSGTFDMFHIGHLNVLKKSKALGDYLIVGVSRDELVESYKKARPIIPFEDRVEIVRHLDFVDQVVPQENLFDSGLMRAYGVNVMTIGDDWRSKSNQNLSALIDSSDIEVVFLPYTQSVSSTSIKEKIAKGWQDDK